MTDLVLLAAGASALVLTIHWFARDRTRVRFSLVVLASAAAFLCTGSDGFVALSVIAIAGACVAGRGTTAGALGAAAIGAVLVMWHILPLLANERPGDSWPWTVTAAIPFLLPRGRLTMVLAAVLVAAGLVFSAPAMTVVAMFALIGTANTHVMVRRGLVVLAVVVVTSIALLRTMQQAREPMLRIQFAPSYRVDVPHLPFAPDDVLVDHLPAKIERLGAPRRSAASAHREVKVDAAGHVHIRSDGWNLVVTNQPARPGWRVYWNGERLPPVTVKRLFVGTFVPPGSGVLALRFRPDQMDDGLRLSVLGLILFAVMLWRRWYLGEGQRLAGLLPHEGLPIGISSGFLLAGYLVILLANFSDVAGGADSSGYLNFSRLWEQRQMIVPLTLAVEFAAPPELDPLFIPLGFVPGPRPHTMVPSYPPGLPLIMAGARAVGGELSAFRVVALLAASGVLLMYLLGRATGLPRIWSVAAAAILALCPTYVFMGTQPMSDTVATALAILAVVAALRGRNAIVWALLSGAALGAGVMVRPTQVLLFPALLVALRFRPRALAALCAGALPFGIAQMLISQHIYDDPFATGYGSVTDMFTSFEGFVIRFQHYLFWLAALAGPLVAPGGMTAWFDRNTDRWTRVMLAAWFLPFFLFYCWYVPYETWWYTRFLLPALPALIIGGLVVLRSYWPEVEGRWRALPAFVIAGTLAVEVAQCARFQVLENHKLEEKLREPALGATRHLPPDAIVIVGHLNGAVRYYTGRDLVNVEGIGPHFERLRDTFSTRPWFALMKDDEFGALRRNAPGNWVEVERYRGAALLRLESELADNDRLQPATMH